MIRNFGDTKTCYDTGRSRSNDEDNKRLHEVLAIAAARRDENGNINESREIFKYVPSKAYRSEASYNFAKDILTKATADAVGHTVADLNK